MREVRSVGRNRSNPAPTRDRAGARLSSIARPPKEDGRENAQFSPGDLCYLAGQVSILPQRSGSPLPHSVRLPRGKWPGLAYNDPRTRDTVVWHPWTAKFPCTAVALTNGFVLLQWWDNKTGLNLGWVDGAQCALDGTLTRVTGPDSVARADRELVERLRGGDLSK